MTTGLLGGAFDPPHLGHVALAKAAIARFELARLVVVPVGNAPEEFARFVQTEIERWGKVVRFSGAKPE